MNVSSRPRGLLLNGGTIAAISSPHVERLQGLVGGVGPIWRYRFEVETLGLHTFLTWDSQFDPLGVYTYSTPCCRKSAMPDLTLGLEEAMRGRVACTGCGALQGLVASELVVPAERAGFVSQPDRGAMGKTAVAHWVACWVGELESALLPHEPHSALMEVAHRREEAFELLRSVS